MKVLVACEESQAVTKAFRAKGHEAYSCDIQECSGGHPEWHIAGDVLKILNHDWDMIIAFPPCTHLAVSGAAWFKGKRQDGSQEQAIRFFMQIIGADCKKIAVENPVNIIGGEYIKKWFPDLCDELQLPIKPTQYIQPYEHGDATPKKTGLWLKGLPELTPTNIVEPEYIIGKKDGKKYSKIHYKSVSMAKGDRSKARSKTFPGIAQAMADQWG